MNRVEQTALFTALQGDETIQITSPMTGEMRWTTDQLAAAITQRISDIAAVQASTAANAVATSVVSDVLQVAVPATGAAVQIATGTTILVVNNASLLLALSITLPSTPRDAQRITICTASAVTSMTMSGDQPIKGTLTSMSLNSYARFIYVAAASAWFRIG